MLGIFPSSLFLMTAEEALLTTNAIGHRRYFVVDFHPIFLSPPFVIPVCIKPGMPLLPNPARVCEKLFCTHPADSERALLPPTNSIS